MTTQTFSGIAAYLQKSNYQEIFSDMSDDKPYIEQVREFLGLLIVLLYCIFVAFLHRSNNRKK